MTRISIRKINPEETSRVLDAVAADFISADVNLLPRVVVRFEKKSFGQALRARPALMIVLILLALALLTGVAYAVSHSTGYIPGVGLVEQEYGVRILAAPVSAGKNQMKVTVKQVVADAVRTFISYKVAGISPAQNGFSDCTEPPSLQLPDGRRLDFLSGGAGGMESEAGSSMTLETSYVFPPVPAGVMTVTFLSPCAQPAIVLELVRAPDGFATPVVEIGATYSASGPSFASEASTATSMTQPAVVGSTPAATFTIPPFTPQVGPNASGLNLDKVVELQNTVILIGHFADKGDMPGHFTGSSGELNYLVKITDAHGQVVDFLSRPDLVIEPHGNGVGWAYEIKKSVISPVTITLLSIPISLQKNIQLGLDAGSSPQPGQKWILNQTVRFSEHDYIIDDITALKNGYAVHLHTDPDASDYFSLQFEIVSVANSGGTGIVDHRADKILYGESVIFGGTPPSGNLTFSLIFYDIVQLPGPWTLSWSAPVGK